MSHSLPQTAAMTLSEFLLARIAEDEAAARAQLELRAERYPGEIAEPGPAYEVDRGWWLLADPARVLAECEAKRRIVKAESRRRTKDNVSAMSRTKGVGDEWVDVTWLDEDYRPHDERVRSAEFHERFTEPSPPNDTSKFLALPYAAHPDYRDEWRP